MRGREDGFGADGGFEGVDEGAENPAVGEGETARRRPKHPGRRSVGWALVHAARLHRTRLGDRLATLGLFPGQEGVLQALAAEGPLGVGELAEALRVRPPTASKAVSRLKALGLIERDAEGAAKRHARVVLTEAGRARLEAVERVGREVEGELLAGFDGKDRRRLRRLLRRAARNLVEAGASETADPEPDGAA